MGCGFCGPLISRLADKISEKAGGESRQYKHAAAQVERRRAEGYRTSSTHPTGRNSRPSAPDSLFEWLQADIAAANRVSTPGSTIPSLPSLVLPGCLPSGGRIQTRSKVYSYNVPSTGSLVPVGLGKRRDQLPGSAGNRRSKIWSEWKAETVASPPMSTCSSPPPPKEKRVLRTYNSNYV